MSKYTPELGQMCFGTMWESNDCSEISELMYLLADEATGESAYAGEFSNNTFTMKNYYWGECECGFEERYDNSYEEWRKTHNHTKECIHTKYKEWSKDVSFIDPNYRSKAEKFAKDNGLKSDRGIAVICNCPYAEAYTEFESKIGVHGPNCGIVAPNFEYLKGNVKVYWYKYIGRGMTCNKKLDYETWKNIIKDCLKSLDKGW